MSTPLRAPTDPQYSLNLPHTVPFKFFTELHAITLHVSDLIHDTVTLEMCATVEEASVPWWLTRPPQS